jgi:hypothetical protein
MVHLKITGRLEQEQPGTIMKFQIMLYAEVLHYDALQELVHGDM